MPITIEELQNRFTYHAPKPGQPAKYEALRSSAFNLSVMIVDLCPDSREQSLALTKLEECIMHANSAIARRE